MKNFTPAPHVTENSQPTAGTAAAAVLLALLPTLIVVSVIILSK